MLIMIIIVIMIMVRMIIMIIITVVIITCSTFWHVGKRQYGIVAICHYVTAMRHYGNAASGNAALWTSLAFNANGNANGTDRGAMRRIIRIRRKRRRGTHATSARRNVKHLFQYVK